MAAHLFAIGNSVQLVADWLFSGFTPIGKQGYQDCCLSSFLHQLRFYLWRNFWIVCSRSASFWLDTEVVNVNFCVMGSSMYVDIRFAIFNDLLQTHYCIITSRLHAIINLTPFKHKLVADSIFYHLPDASKSLWGGQLSDRRPGLHLWSNHFKCNETTILLFP